jgi:hypothetical protein
MGIEVRTLSIQIFRVHRMDGGTSPMLVTNRLHKILLTIKIYDYVCKEIGPSVVTLQCPRTHCDVAVGERSG